MDDFGGYTREEITELFAWDWGYTSSRGGVRLHHVAKVLGPDHGYVGAVGRTSCGMTLPEERRRAASAGRGDNRVMDFCPTCNEPLGGLATFCHYCRAYVDDMGAEPDATPEARKLYEDTRLEADIRLGIRGALEAHGFDVYDLEQNRKTRQTAGLADLFVVGHGRCAWVEVKRPKGQQSGPQKLFEKRVTANGGTYMVWRHEDDAIGWAEAVKREAA